MDALDDFSDGFSDHEGESSQIEDLQSSKNVKSSAISEIKEEILKEKEKIEAQVKRYEPYYIMVLLRSKFTAISKLTAIYLVLTESFICLEGTIIQMVITIIVLKCLIQRYRNGELYPANFEVHPEIVQ